MFTSDMFYTFLSFIIQSSTYAVFPIVSVRDKIFILFLLETWPEYVFLKYIPDPSQKQMTIL
jgi:hypothetical protein